MPNCSFGPLSNSLNLKFWSSFTVRLWKCRVSPCTKNFSWPIILAVDRSRVRNHEKYLIVLSCTISCVIFFIVHEFFRDFEPWIGQRWKSFRVLPTCICLGKLINRFPATILKRSLVISITAVLAAVIFSDLIASVTTVESSAISD